MAGLCGGQCFHVGRVQLALCFMWVVCVARLTVHVGGVVFMWVMFLSSFGETNAFWRMLKRALLWS